MNESQQPARICLLTTELAPGGAERCLVNLAVGLDPRQFAVRVLSLRPLPVSPKEGLLDKLKVQSIPVESLQATSSRHFFSARRRLSHYLRDHRIDLLQTFLYHGNILGAVAKVADDQFVRVGGIRVADPSRWRQRLEGWAARRWNHVICVSNDVATQASQYLPLSQSQLTVIPNGVDAAAFSQSPTNHAKVKGLPAGRKLLLSVGRLDRQKGLDWLLALAPDLLEQCPQHDLVFVGNGPEKSALQQQASRTGISARVHFLGWRSDIAQIMQAADLLLLPSRWEGMPNVLLEAMASSLPLVTRPVEGVLEILGQEGKSQCVTSNSADDFRDRVKQLVDDPAQREQLGQQNRARIGRHFTITAMVDRYAELYSQLLASS